MKRVLIIGATSAIAIACARLWAAQGAFLVLLARNTDKLEEVRNDLLVRGATAVHCMHFEADNIAGHGILMAAVSALSQAPLDIALLAHGVLPDQRRCEVDLEALQAQFTINAVSILSWLTLLANQFEHQRHGRLAVITSVAGVRGRPSNYAYGSAKAAVSVFCEGMRARLHAAGITLTDIRPGFVATPMTSGLVLPSLLVATPEVVAVRIVNAVEKGQGTVYAPSYWALIMLAIQLLPSWLFNRMRL